MKRGVKFLCLFMAVMVVSGCSNNSETGKSDQDDTKQTTEAKDGEETDPADDSEVEEELTAEESVPVESVDKTKVYVTPEWVQSVIDGEQPESEDYVIIEASWGSAGDSPDYKKEHIPGSVHGDISSIESEPYWNLSEPDVVEKAILDLGVTKDTTAIFYGLDSGTTRMAFAFLWAGVENVKVLNGGLQSWKEAGFDTEEGENTPEPKSEFGVEVPAHPEYSLDIEDAKDKLENDVNFRLVSIRSKDEFDGVTSGYNYIDKAGEPKGAVWGHAGSDPYSMEDYTNEDGTYISLEQAQELWKDYDISLDNDLSFYCGTGWRATIPWLLCYEAGNHATVFDGGWYQWQMNDDYPVQVGDPDSEDVVYTTVGELSTDKAAQ